MKTNILFKHTLSLLTLGLVVFSCTRPTEGPKTKEEYEAGASEKSFVSIKSFVFTKAANSTGTPASAATPSEAYKALFIKRTPALPYTDDIYNKFEARIESDGIIKVLVPFDKTLNISAPVTLKAIITLSGKLGPNIYLGDEKTPLDSTVTSFDYDITTELIHSKLIKAEGISHSFKLSRKEKGSNPIEKVCKVVFVHDKPSADCTIGQDDFKFIVAESGINAIGNFRTINSTARAANSIVRAHYAAANTASSGSGPNDGSEAKPFEFQLRIKKSTATTPGPATDATDGELEQGADASKYFKADALKLPDGAFIEVGDTACTTPNGGGGAATVCCDVNPITGLKKTGGATGAITDLKGTSGQAKVEYKFTVVAQDGKTKKHYKLTINAEAPTAPASN
ncbi:hypothetical protein [Ichthyobacterium seriolicida]|uniref:Lipoprotein n=1 Tax=Ichthyobacterium seriolicida TaxID=242600 RepID=A0A1J1E3Y5_9FLAO|nr:hypothetical protein [Ichthyobacterium seriolicida]BAV94030.1 hypothetical protein JBKA6_0017 [Ichthyobacterium seriolicida]